MLRDFCRILALNSVSTVRQGAAAASAGGRRGRGRGTGVRNKSALLLSLCRRHGGNLAVSGPMTQGAVAGDGPGSESFHKSAGPAVGVGSFFFRPLVVKPRRLRYELHAYDSDRQLTLRRGSTDPDCSGQSRPGPRRNPKSSGQGVTGPGRWLAVEIFFRLGRNCFATALLRELARPESAGLEDVPPRPPAVVPDSATM